MSKPLVYVIIVNYKSVHDTIKCIGAIRKLQYENYRLLVIDNNSRDKSCEILEKLLSSDELHIMRKNTGYAGGNNYGIEISLANKADYIFILNPDVIISSDSLVNYISIMENNKNIGALNPIQYSSEEGLIDQRFRSRVLKEISDEELLSAVEKCQLIEVDTLFGASIVLPRSTFLKVGGFDPLYFAYYEEEDLCRRIKYHNLSLYVTMKCPVIHLRNYQQNSINKFRQYLRLKGRYLFILKNINRGNYTNLKYFYYNLRSDFKSEILSNKNKEILKNYFMVMLWIFINYPRIIFSRKIEKQGFSHLKINF